MQPKAKAGLKPALKWGEISGSMLFSSQQSSGNMGDMQPRLAWGSLRGKGKEMVTFILFIKPLLKERWVSMSPEERICSWLLAISIPFEVGTKGTSSQSLVFNHGWEGKGRLFQMQISINSPGIWILGKLPLDTNLKLIQCYICLHYLFK